MSGENVTKLLDQAYWEQMDSSPQNLVYQAQYQIGAILKLMGKHNYPLKLADVYCGLGVMVHLLRDAHYDNVVGIDDSPAVTAYWEDSEGLEFGDPLNTEYEDASFDIVTCFDGSRTDDHTTLLREMARLTKKHLFFRPDSKLNPSMHDDVMRLLLAERLKMTQYNSFHGWYQIEK